MEGDQDLVFLLTAPGAGWQHSPGYLLQLQFRLFLWVSCPRPKGPCESHRSKGTRAGPYRQLTQCPNHTLSQNSVRKKTKNMGETEAWNRNIASDMWFPFIELGLVIYKWLPDVSGFRFKVCLKARGSGPPV